MPPMLNTDTSVCKIMFVWLSMVVIVGLDRLAACASLIACLSFQAVIRTPFPSHFTLLQVFLINDYFAPPLR
jgi:hypothetical protein